MAKKKVTKKKQSKKNSFSKIGMQIRSDLISDLKDIKNDTELNEYLDYVTASYAVKKLKRFVELNF